MQSIVCNIILLSPPITHSVSVANAHVHVETTLRCIVYHFWLFVPECKSYSDSGSNPLIGILRKFFFFYFITKVFVQKIRQIWCMFGVPYSPLFRESSTLSCIRELVLYIITVKFILTIKLYVCIDVSMYEQNYQKFSFKYFVCAYM